MKKLATVMALVLILLLPVAALAETVVTSFYPIYLFVQELTDGAEGLEVHNLAAPETGCLHDYQLSTGDMKALAQADAFLINGAGMEGYLSYVFEAFPQLTVVDASQGVELLPSETGETEYNAHIWLDAVNAQVMVQNLAEGLQVAFPQYEAVIAANCERYTARLALLDEELKAGLATVTNNKIVTFHEAFPYFANAYGLEVVATIVEEEDESLSAYELTQLIRTVKDNGNPPLFTEPQYRAIAAETVAAETGAKMYELDPCVTGPAEPTSTYYEDVMRENLKVLELALAE